MIGIPDMPGNGPFHGVRDGIDSAERGHGRATSTDRIGTRTEDEGVMIRMRMAEGNTEPDLVGSVFGANADPTAEAAREGIADSHSRAPSADGKVSGSLHRFVVRDRQR